MQPASRRAGRLSLTRGLVVALLVAAAAIALAEGAARAWLGSRGPEAQPAAIHEEVHSEYDPLLGWINLANARVEDVYGPGTTYTTNSRRLRATREYTRATPDGVFRVLCLGDSFTMGFGVDDDETFPAQLDAREGLEAINMGLGGFGIDQDYLWYTRDGVELDCDLLLFSVIADDFRRALVDEFQPGVPKPRFDLVDEELVLRNTPVPRGSDARPSWFERLVQRSAVVQAFRSAPRATRPGPGARGFEALAERLFRELADLSRERGQRFAIVFLPTIGQLQRGEPPLAAWLRELCAEAGIDFHDVTPAFDPVPEDELGELFTQGHYSARGNALVAESLAGFIDERYRD